MIGYSPMIHDRRTARLALAVLYGLASLVSLGMGLAPLLGFRCEACSGGLLALAMPWIGAAFYGALAAVALRAPQAAALALLPGFYVFVHGDLVTEMLLDRRCCWGCLTVAALALAASAVPLLRAPREGVGIALAAILGIAAGVLSSFDRADELVTRTLWPARMLEAAPAWVSRDEMNRCGHDAPIRILLFEKDCKT